MVERSKELAMTAEKIDEEATEATKTTILGLQKSLRSFDKAIAQANELMDTNAQHIWEYLTDSKSALEDANKLFLILSPSKMEDSCIKSPQEVCKTN